jgi:hypothetical protein
MTSLVSMGKSTAPHEAPTVNPSPCSLSASAARAATSRASSTERSLATTQNSAPHPIRARVVTERAGQAAGQPNEWRIARGMTEGGACEQASLTQAAGIRQRRPAQARRHAR